MGCFHPHGAKLFPSKPCKASLFPLGSLDVVAHRPVLVPCFTNRNPVDVGRKRSTLIFVWCGLSLWSRMSWQTAFGPAIVEIIYKTRILRPCIRRSRSSQVCPILTSTGGSVLFGIRLSLPFHVITNRPMLVPLFRLTVRARVSPVDRILPDGHGGPL